MFSGHLNRGSLIRSKPILKYFLRLNAHSAWKMLRIAVLLLDFAYIVYQKEM